MGILKVSIRFKRESTCALKKAVTDQHPNRSVSIPFKRESTCALTAVEWARQAWAIQFPFPSNGKAHVHATDQLDRCRPQVLFPFPSNGKAHVHKHRSDHHEHLNLFPFPSNGKAHVHTGSVVEYEDGVSGVSIPFKRESTCAQTPTMLTQSRGVHIVSIPFKRESTCAQIPSNFFFNDFFIRFHSLQTGKHMCTVVCNGTGGTPSLVSIPFKRESTCARKGCLIPMCQLKSVSIPFKRESTCAQIKQPLIWLIPLLSSFHSLQTGKHMGTHTHGTADFGDGVSIPFKRESTCARRLYIAEWYPVRKRFHSLQTGKHMCTEPLKASSVTVTDCFHSLQTGKHMCTGNEATPAVEQQEVSIPFKRESTCALIFRVSLLTL